MRSSIQGIPSTKVLGQISHGEMLKRSKKDGLAGMPKNVEPED
jgi:hypothetical protein